MDIEPTVLDYGMVDIELIELSLGLTSGLMGLWWKFEDYIMGFHQQSDSWGCLRMVILNKCAF